MAIRAPDGAKKGQLTQKISRKGIKEGQHGHLKFRFAMLFRIGKAQFPLKVPRHHHLKKNCPKPCF